MTFDFVPFLAKLGALPKAIRAHIGKLGSGGLGTAFLAWVGLTDSALLDLQAWAYALGDYARAWGDLFGFAQERL